MTWTRWWHRRPWFQVLTAQRLLQPRRLCVTCAFLSQELLLLLSRVVTPVFARTALTNSLEWIYAVLCVALTLLLSCSCTVDFKMSLNDFDFTATCIHYKTVLLPNSSTYKFQPCCRYWQIPVLANSIPVLFTDTFQYLQIPPLLPLLANSLPAFSMLGKKFVLLPNSSTCKFLLSVFTVRIQYLQFPLLANSYNPRLNEVIGDEIIYTCCSIVFLQLNILV